jgi:hypothetical protein
MKLHSILATNKNNLTTLLVKDLTWFYIFCFDGKWVDCQNLWWICHLVPKIPQHVDTRSVCGAMYDSQDGKWDYSVDVNALTTTLEVGDNFAVIVKIGNLKCFDFWVFCCTKPMHTIRKEFTNKWGTSFVIGDVVVAGLYYQSWGSSDESFVLLKHSHVM